LHDARAFGQAHDAEPKRHDPDEAECDRNRGLGAVQRATGHIFQLVVPAADDDCANDER
jgi:hypothetical protein